CSRLETVNIGTDSNGRPINSCIIVPAESRSSPGDRGKKMSGATLTAYDALQEVLNDCGSPVESEKIPPQVKVVSIDQWRQQAFGRGISESSGRDARRIAFNRARSKLRDEGKIGIWDDKVWIVP